MEEDHPLRKWREDNGVTLSVLAEKVNVEASHLSMVERGKRHVSHNLLRRLREVTGLPSRDLAPEIVESVNDGCSSEAAS